MSNSTQEARQLAAVFKNAAKDGVLEKPFRDPVEAHLFLVARSAGIELVPHTEVTMGTSGRADTIYNRFIVEWKQPGLFSASNNATANSKAIAQLKGYVETFWFSNRQKPGRVVGCCTDGRYFIFATKPGHEWHVSDPVPVDEQTCRKFLDYFFSLHSGIALLPEYLAEDFSAENVRTQRTVKALYESLEKHAHSPSLEAIFDQWAQFFGAVTEYEQWSVKLANEAELRKTVKAFGIPQDKLDLNRFFFATHTFFAILTKLLAYVIVGRYTDLPTPPLEEWKNLTNDQLAAHFAALEKGGPFHAAGIRNFLEGDFFAWYVKYFTPELAACLKAVVERLADYDPATLDLAPGPTQDMLKKLYHRLVSAHIRKALGEFYTPDWLAQRLLNMLDGGRFQGDPQKRLLDPTCGSGTILVQTINAIRTNSIAQSMDQGELLRTICQNVVGIDLNPLAVIAARTNYLLALGPLLKSRGTEPLEVPVYLADSVMTPSRGDTHDLFETDKVRVWLSIGKVELPLRLAWQGGVAALTHLLDEHLEKTPSTPPGKFTGLAEKRLKESYSTSKLTEQGLTSDGAWKKDEATIAALYTRLHELHAAGRNGLWARIIKNAFAPVFLAPFDYVAGNPPWINWQNLPEGYRNESKSLWVQHGLFVHKGMDTILGKGKKDISTLITYVAADSYLKDGGKLGFVITQAVFKTSGAGQGFRRFITRKKEPLAVIWVDDFSELQLFEGASNRTVVFIMRKGQPTKYPVQYAYWRKKESGRKGSFDYDSTLAEVTEKTERLQFVAEPVSASDATSAWLTGRRKAIAAVRKLLGVSEYAAHAGAYTGGANAVYWFEILKAHDDGTVTARNITEGAKRKIESVQVRLEKELLYLQLRGRDVRRWKAVPTAHILFVQDVRKRSGIDEGVMKAKYPLAYKWLLQNKEVLLKRSSQSIKHLMDTGAFYSIFAIGDYTLARFKVIWLAFGARRVNAAVSEYVDGKPVCGNQAMHMAVPCDSLVEAYYLAGCVNSSPFNAAVVMHTQIGGKSFAQGSILKSIRVPKFDDSNSAHKKVVEVVRELHKHLDDEVTLRADEESLDDAIRAVWGLDKDELAAARQVCEELSGVDFEGEEQPATEE
ncbi:MAG: N-6 DNA methylase [Verrucomicrobia bacterium]|nr:N-6 DNA methylase [Verrucomicrobiota bacterium]